MPVRISLDKKTNRYHFNAAVNTTQFADGARVILFRSRDALKSEGVQSFLLFVNNTPPQVEIVYPGEEEAVNGIFTVAGYAMHDVGLASLTWTLGKETGELPLIIGNPWWVKEFDIRGQTVKNLNMEIRAVDLSGNVTITKRNLIVNQEADLPVVTLTEPSAGSLFTESGLTVSGFAADGDAEGIEAVLYSLNGEAPLEIPATDQFRFTLAPPASALKTNTLEIWARDTTGVEGRKTVIKDLIDPGIAPRLTIASMSSGAGKTAVTEPFHSGLEINSEAGVSLNVLIQSGSPLQTVSYQFGSRDPVPISIKAGKGGDYVQSIPIEPGSDYGRVALQVTAVDIYNRETSLEDILFITDLSAPPVSEANRILPTRLRDGPLSLIGLNGSAEWSDRITLQYGEKNPIPMTAILEAGVTISKVTASVSDRPAKVSVKDGSIQASLPADLLPGLNTVTLTALLKSGEQYTVTGEFWVLRPTEGRHIDIEESFIFCTPMTGSPQSGAKTGSVLKNGELLLLTGETMRGLYFYNGRSLKTAELSGDGSEHFRVRIDENGLVLIEGTSKGLFGPLTLTLTNSDDKTVSVDSSFLVLNGSPDLQVQGPANKWVQNSAEIQIQSRDAPWLERLEYSADQGSTWHELLSGQLLLDTEPALLGEAEPYIHSMDLSAFADGSVTLDIKATDKAGRSTIQTASLYKDTQAPLATLAVPTTGASVNGIIRMGMVIQDAGRIASIRYELPGDPEPETEEGTEAEELEAAPRREPISKVVYDHTIAAGQPPLHFFEAVLDTLEMPLSDAMSFVFTDMAGNSFALSDWNLIIDKAMDLPIVQISLPTDNEVITADFTVSGISYDDDNVRYLHWRIDNEAEQSMEVTHGFSIPIALYGMDDNEHTITMYVEDIYGVIGLPQTRSFRVSLAEPTGTVLGPELGEILGGTVQIFGTADDRNGIKRVQISLDNGNTFNDADRIYADAVTDTETVADTAIVTDERDWSYTLNTKILQDGPTVLFIKLLDEYDISALYASMLVIDNTPPELSLDSPSDGVLTNGMLSIAGNSHDNSEIESIQVKLSSLEGVAIPEELALRNVPVGTLILEELYLTDLPEGTYNVEIWATDKAKNTTALSRNIKLVHGAQLNFVDILYPLNGEYVQGSFNLYGYVSGVDTAEEVLLTFNGTHVKVENITPAGYFRFSIDETDMVEGINTLMVKSLFGGTQTVESPVQRIYYTSTGPWVTVDSMTMGDFAYERPWLRGRAGYVLTPEEEALLADKATLKELRSVIEAKKLAAVELSFDNGNTFVPVEKAKGEYDWQYRLEDGDMREGVHYLMVRASMANGEKAVTRLLVQVDKTPPVIRLFTPESGGRYNNELPFGALAQDDNELQDLTYHLRKGDKSAYEVPGFLQGLYLEGIIPPFIRQLTNDAPAILFAGGATYTDFGLGLSFFDDNVKIQVQYGFITQDIFESLGGAGALRYGGQVLGLKLLANIYTLPFASLFGPDWAWLSASFGIGANFSLFDIAGEGYTQSGSPTWMSALLVQLEFPKVTIPKRSFLRTFSMFTEGQLWFVPTDVDAAAYNLATVIPHITIGLRLYIF
jgi:hypothetical protein